MYERFKALLLERGVKVTEVAKATGISDTNFTDWKNGRTTFKVDKLLKLAEYFDVSLDYLVGNTDDKKAVRIPVLGVVAAGVPISAQENILDYEEITEAMSRKGEYFGLIVKGDSMQPRFFEGDIAIVRVQPDAESGDVVIAKVNGNEACVKKLLKYAHGIGLQSYNPAYKTIMFNEAELENNPVTIIGKVVQVRGNV